MGYKIRTMGWSSRDRSYAENIDPCRPIVAIVLLLDTVAPTCIKCLPENSPTVDSCVSSRQWAKALALPSDYKNIPH